MILSSPRDDDDDDPPHHPTLSASGGEGISYERSEPLALVVATLAGLLVCQFASLLGWPGWLVASIL